MVARDSDDTGELCSVNQLRQEIDRTIDRDYSKGDRNEYSKKLLYYQGIPPWNATIGQRPHRHRFKCFRILWPSQSKYSPP